MVDLLHLIVMADNPMPGTGGSDDKGDGNDGGSGEKK